MTLPEFYQQISRRLRHQFGSGVRDAKSIVKGKFQLRKYLTLMQPLPRDPKLPGSLGLAAIFELTRRGLARHPPEECRLRNLRAAGDGLR
jgi:hypothetical protein